MVDWISHTFFCTVAGMANEPVRRPERPEVAAGMAAARERGVKLGRPRLAALPPSARRAGELRAQGLSLNGIAAALNEEHVPTVKGNGAWTKSTVQYLLKRLDDGEPVAE